MQLLPTPLLHGFFLYIGADYFNHLSVNAVQIGETVFLGHRQNLKAQGAMKKLFGKSSKQPVPKKKNITLHIGRNKTGSSALQTFLCMNKSALEAEGFFYPATEEDLHNAINGYPTAGNARTLTRLVEDKLERHKGERDQTALRLTDTDLENVVLSSELLGKCSQSGFEDLKLMFPGSNFKVIMYIRDQAAYLTSQYQQTIKLGHTPGTLEEFCVTGGFIGGKGYSEIIERTETVFGKENLVVKLYDNGAFEGGTIFSDFTSLLGISDIENWEYPDRRVNTSLTELEVAALIELRQFFEKRMKVRKIGQGLQRARVRLGQDMNEYLSSEPFRISREAYDIVCERFAEENKFLNENYLMATPIVIKEPAVFHVGPRPSFSSQERAILLLLASYMDVN